MEDPVHMVERVWCRLVLDGRADRLAADHALQAPMPCINRSTVQGANSNPSRIIRCQTGAISTSAREYFGNPASWWLSRGARYVVFLEADDGDAPQPDGPMEPDGPVDGDEGGIDRRRDAAAWPKEKRPAARLAHHLRKPRGTVPDGLTAAEEAEKDLADGAILAGAGSLIRLEWRHHDYAGWQVGDWILLPYVHPVDRAVRSRFQRAITKALKIKGGNEEKLATKLIEHLGSYEKTKVLLDIYGEYFGHGQNALSMSLYSGPYCRSEGTVDSDHRWHRYGWPYANFPHHYPASLNRWAGSERVIRH
jgi:hypothetical protein